MLKTDKESKVEVAGPVGGRRKTDRDRNKKREIQRK